MSIKNTNNHVISHAGETAETLISPSERSSTSAEYLFHENNQGLAVVFPLFGQLALVGILVTANIDGELKAVGVQVAEVIDACQ